ncbi:alpha/beta fold hydrolase [Alkalihalobacillus sp. BA299]|uniref:alpha/beta fold hydrolase n=1 Tax=Alkalihalobacillus sp. BA299 TaxID=2815938 RepID=UPI001ADB4A54|nr:alpha/beta hydrolase [Alkalihalobacillus sp. BA299]
MYKVNVNNVTVHYQRLGNGTPLVLIHGLGEIKEGWVDQHELANEYDLIIPDLRGHGESETYEGISIKNFAHDVIGLLDELRIENAHICGLSMGGTVAQEIYRQAPGRCRSLILVSTFHYAPKTLGRYFLKFKKLRGKLLTPKMQREVAARTCLYDWDSEKANKFFQFYNPKPNSYRKSMEACLGIDNRKLLPTIKVPTLIIGCQYDTVVPLWIQIMMHESIPHSELVIFKNVGHIAKLEDTEKFNRTLRSFLGKHSEEQVR